MALYKISEETIDLSEIGLSKTNDKLKPLVGQTGKVFCLCTDSKPPMHVSRRDNNYFPVKEKQTGHLHYKLCRHHALTVTEAASMGYTLEALGRSAANGDSEEFVVTLSKPLKAKADVIAAETTEFAFRRGPARSITNRMTELGLLHFLWERAKLHEYNAGAIVNSLWPKIRGAAHDIRPAGMKSLQHGISDLLILPIHDETPNQIQRNRAKFGEAQEKKRFLLFVVKLNQDEVAKLLNARNEDFSLRGKFGISINLYKGRADPVLNALSHSFKEELKCSQTDGDDLVVLGIAEPNKDKNYAQISSMVVMPVVAEHIPFDSSYERQFALQLIHQARRFKKPLRYEAARDMQVHPDFVFLDTKEPIVVEIYGMTNQTYLDRKREKRSIYESEEYPFDCWEWEAAQCKNLTDWLAERPLPLPHS